VVHKIKGFDFHYHIYKSKDGLIVYGEHDLVEIWKYWLKEGK